MAANMRLIFFAARCRPTSKERAYNVWSRKASYSWTWRRH